MFIRLVISIMFVLVLLPVTTYAETDILLAESMLENLRVDNTKKVNIPGSHGILRIFLEKTKAPIVPNGVIELIYDGTKTVFKMQGSSLAITQDGKLVFAIKDNKVYAKAVHGCKESFAITYKNITYTYNEQYMLINHKGQTFKFSEVVYNSQQNTFKVYDNSKYIKTVEIK